MLDNSIVGKQIANLRKKKGVNSGRIGRETRDILSSNQ